ncbi:MAG: PepSY domain-containing protein [Flavobacteriaceae bacterium]|nr:PepSY domain-containing protein [Flavobacteriaceae bacterium]
MLKKTRKWHNWIGLILSIPTFIVGFTALLITFEGAYKNNTSEPLINVAWLPGYSKILSNSVTSEKSPRIRASLSLSLNERFIGTSNGLYVVRNHQVTSITTIEGTAVHCLHKTDSCIWIGTKKGLFKMELSSRKTSVTFDKEIHHIESPNDSTLLISDNKTLYISTNKGGSWRKDSLSQNLHFPIIATATSQQTKSIKLHKLIIDMHTGKAFLGKKLEGIWVFILGLSLSVLSFTGSYMWYKKRSNKAKRATKALDIKRKKDTRKIQ